MKTVLVVVDVQESFRARPYWSNDGFPQFIANVQSLINRCRARGIPVVQVFHQEHEGADNPFSPASGFVRPMEELDLEPDAIFHKEVHSALFGKDRRGVTLEQWLRDEGIEEILVTGIRTEQCCETTTRHASDLGYRVQYITDATLTFPMQARNGRRFSVDELRERTELVLDGRFAKVVATADVV